MAILPQKRITNKGLYCTSDSTPDFKRLWCAFGSPVCSQTTRRDDNTYKKSPPMRLSSVRFLPSSSICLMVLLSAVILAVASAAAAVKANPSATLVSRAGAGIYAPPPDWSQTEDDHVIPMFRRGDDVVGSPSAYFTPLPDAASMRRMLILSRPFALFTQPGPRSTQVHRPTRARCHRSGRTH